MKNLFKPNKGKKKRRDSTGSSSGDEPEQKTFALSSSKKKEVKTAGKLKGDDDADGKSSSTAAVQLDEKQYAIKARTGDVGDHVLNTNIVRGQTKRKPKALSDQQPPRDPEQIQNKREAASVQGQDTNVLKDHKTAEATRNEIYTTGQFEELGLPYQLGRPIPTIIHRFWSGGPMSENTMNVLIDSATKVKGKKWSNRLWYSVTLEKELYSNKRPVDQIGGPLRELLSTKEKRILLKEERVQLEKQRMQLEKLGFTVTPIEGLASEIMKQCAIENIVPPVTLQQIEKFAKGAAAMRIRGGKQSAHGIKHLSDVARLMYAYYHGGHHFDTDMALGTMSLDHAYKHNDPESNVPLMGAVGVVPYDYEKITGLKPGEPIDVGTDEGLAAAAKLIREAPEMATTLNGMFATRAKNPHIKEALTAIAQLYDKVPTLSTPGTNLSTIMVYGKEIADNFDSPKSKVKTAMRKMTVPPYILDVEAFTAESAIRNVV